MNKQIEKKQCDLRGEKHHKEGKSAKRAKRENDEIGMELDSEDEALQIERMRKKRNELLEKLKVEKGLTDNGMEEEQQQDEFDF